MKSKSLKEDLAIVQEIDKSDVDLPEGGPDLIERCLRQLTIDKQELKERDRAKLKILLAYVRQLKSDDDT